MNFLTNITGLEKRGLIAIMVALTLAGLFCLLATSGCNTGEIARYTKAIWDIDAEIELIEMGLVSTRSKLELLPLTELVRKELEVQAKELERKLTILQTKKGRLIKTAEQLKKEDDALLAEVDQTAQEMLPYGLGGIATSLLLMGRGFLRNRNLKKVFKSMEPLIKDANPEMIKKISSVQGPGGKRLVDGFQGKRPSLPI